jgi:hypothetical protein
MTRERDCQAGLKTHLHGHNETAVWLGPSDCSRRGTRQKVKRLGSVLSAAAVNCH